MLYLSHLLKDEEMKRLCDTYKAGLESIDFSIGENLQDVEGSLKQYEKRIQFINPPAITVHGPFVDMSPISYDREIARITYKRFSAAHFAAKKLGAKKLIIHTCLVPQIYFIETWVERTIGFWNYFLDKHDGVKICLENVLDLYPEPMAKIAQEVNLENLGICLDFGHANTFSNTKVEEWANVLSPHIAHIHAHDNLGDADSHLALGEGNIALDKVFAELNMKNQEIDITLEHSTVQRVEDSIKWLTKNNILYAL